MAPSEDQIRQQLRLVESQLNSAKTPGRDPLAPAGSGPHDPHMEARVAKLEAAVEHIQADIKDIKESLRDILRDARVDFRLQFAALIFVALGLAGLMAKGFHWF